MRHEWTAVGARKPLPLTPLIDVVFLLLLFFMLASVFEKTGRLEVIGGSAGVAAQGTPPPVLIRLAADGKLDVNGEASNLSGMAGIVSARRQQSPEAGIIVQVRAGVRTQALVDVLGTLQRAGLGPVAVVR